MKIIMELLPNSKCLTKIKNHLQLGLIRELIGLLPVGKQWGQDNTASHVATIKFPIAFKTVYTVAVSNGGTSSSNLNHNCNAYNINNTGFSVWSIGTFRYIAAGI